MTYKIIRVDGKDDELTAQSFDKYSDAYDLLEELYGDLCCSDADYEDITCLLYTSPSPRDGLLSRMPSSA